MIDILSNDKRRILILTYPKGASTSLRTILLPQWEQRLDTELNQFGERWILDESVRHDQVFDILEKYKGYTMYAFCREPVDRWSSTLLFLMQTKWDLFYSEISDTGQRITDSINADYLVKLVSTMVLINNKACHFDDVHMWRPLFTLLLIKVLHGDKVHLMQLDQMEKLVCDIHDVKRQTFYKNNEAISGYEKGHGYTSNQTHIPTLSTKWKSIVPYAIRNDEVLSPVRNYLSIDNEIYERVVSSGENATDVLLDVLTDERHSEAIGHLGHRDLVLGVNDFKKPLEKFEVLIPQEGDLYNTVKTSRGRFSR